MEDKSNTFSSIEYLTQFGERLRSERQRLKFSQSEVAKIGSITRATQSLYETGDGSPTTLYLAKLATAGFDWHYILTGDIETEFDRVLSKGELIKAFRLTDKLGRDSEGRLLDVSHREELFYRIAIELWTNNGILNEANYIKKTA